jgi:MoxR-like ATPase
LRSEFDALRRHVEQQILGQSDLVERLLIALLADGHLLVEGAPGLAKTKAVKALASGLEGDFHRIQFTPDLLPADLTGTEIYRPQDGSFRFDKGPVFHNLVLADEVNRAPAKVQSALLEAMGERQVTVGRETFRLPELFLVMATQNPIEQEGTYPLPEAQLDRFLMHVRVGYPDLATEHAILDLNREEAKAAAPASNQHRVSQADVFAARRAILDLFMSPDVEDYLVHLVLATRDPSPYGSDLADCAMGPAHAPPSGWTVAHAPAPGLQAATMFHPKTFRRWRRTCCVTVCCCPIRPRRTGAPRRASSSNCWVGWRCPDCSLGS